MATTSRLLIQLLEEAQAGKIESLNAAFQLIDAAVAILTAANQFGAIQTLRVDDAVATVTRPLVLQHGQASGAGASGIGVGVDMQVETATGGTYESAGRINAVATAVTAGAVTGRLDLNVPTAGVFATVMALSSLQAGLSVPLGGSGVTSFAWKRFALTFPSDADYTLLTGEADCPVIDVQAGVITATRNIIVPGTLGSQYWVINRNAQSVVLKTSGGTGITIPSARARCISFPTGVNAFAMSASQDYTT